MQNKIEYMYQVKQVERDMKYLKDTYKFEEIEALKLLIEKYRIRTQAAFDMLVARGGKADD